MDLNVRELRMGTCNCRSILGIYESLPSILHEYDLDTFGLTETWLHKDNN